MTDKQRRGDVKIGIGADHRGYRTKELIKRHLEENGFKIKDFGTKSEKSCDYPDIAFNLASEVAGRKISKGILICSTGIGMSIAANKVRGAYAALCMNEKMARLSRNHNNANILVLGTSLLSKRLIEKIVNVWLIEKFEGGRHRRRYNKIRREEK